MKTKGFIALLLALTASFALFACDATGETTSEISTSVTEESTADETTGTDGETTLKAEESSESEPIPTATESEKETEEGLGETTVKTEDSPAETEPPHVHNFIERSNTATCTEGGRVVKKCACGETEASDSEPLGHKYEVIEKVQPGCVEQGYAEYRCKRCSDSYRKYIAATTDDHHFQMKRVTHGNLSYDAQVCSVCQLEVVAFGNADGSMSGGNSKIKFYVTGEPTFDNEFCFKNYHIVIYGKGEMPTFDKKAPPAWHEYIKTCTKISILEGVTSIGAYAFDCSDPENNITLEMAESVKIIRKSAIKLKLNILRLGPGVTAVESFGIDYTKIKSVFWPKSLEKEDSIFGNSAWSGNLSVHYEGSKKDFLKLTVLYTVFENNVPRNKTGTVKDAFTYYFSRDGVYGSPFYVYVNATDATFENGEYFDAEAVFNK